MSCVNVHNLSWLADYYFLGVKSPNIAGILEGALKRKWDASEANQVYLDPHTYR